MTRKNTQRTIRAILGLMLALAPGCSATPDRESSAPLPQQRSAISLEQPPSVPDLASGKAAPPSPEEFEQQLAESGRQWFYGGGIGRTAANVGAVVFFPPYALYLLGNAGLALAGYEPVQISSLLPEKPRAYVLGAYDGVTSVPGRLNALVAGERFYEERQDKKDAAAQKNSDKDTPITAGEHANERRNPLACPVLVAARRIQSAPLMRTIAQKRPGPDSYRPGLRTRLQ